MKIDLSQFTSKDECRLNIKEPFSYGKEEVAATDGHIAVVIKGRGVESDCPLESVFDRMNLTGEVSKPDLSNLTQTKCNCELKQRACPCCKGEEIVETEYDWEDYEGKSHFCTIDSECPHCEEWQEEHAECKKCNGHGFDYNEKIIKIGTQTFSSEFLFKIKEFKNLTIENAHHLGAARIEFEGGYGLLMPVRVEEEN